MSSSCLSASYHVRSYHCEAVGVAKDASVKQSVRFPGHYCEVEAGIGSSIGNVPNCYDRQHSVVDAWN